MDNKKVLNEIYNLVKEHYGDCLSVNIVVSCEGIDVTTVQKPFTVGCTMKTIDGRWLDKKENYELGLYDE